MTRLFGRFGVGYHGAGAPKPDEDDCLRRIAEAVERIADAIAGPAVVVPAEPLPAYPIVDAAFDDCSMPAEPYIVRSAGGFHYAVCTYCPAHRARAADPGEPSTCLECPESSESLDDMRAALTRHGGHHRQQGDPVAALPIWTWADRPCPRCHAPAGGNCLTTAGRSSTAVHAARWTDHTDEFW